MTTRQVDMSAALNDAGFLLQPNCYQGTNVHNDQWRLDRARWHYQYGDKDAALAELEDINAFRAYWKWEGRPNSDSLPDDVLELPVGELETLGEREQPPWTKHGYVLGSFDRALKHIETGHVDYVSLPAELRERVKVILVEAGEIP